MLTQFLSTIGEVFTTYVPQLCGGAYAAFVNTFCVTDATSHAVTGLNELGILAVALIAMAIVSGLFATILGVLRLRKRSGRKSKKAKR